MSVELDRGVYVRGAWEDQCRLTSSTAGCSTIGFVSYGHNRGFLTRLYRHDTQKKPRLCRQNVFLKKINQFPQVLKVVEMGFGLLWYTCFARLHTRTTTFWKDRHSMIPIWYRMITNCTTTKDQFSVTSHPLCIWPQTYLLGELASTLPGYTLCKTSSPTYVESSKIPYSFGRLWPHLDYHDQWYFLKLA